MALSVSLGSLKRIRSSMPRLLQGVVGCGELSLDYVSDPLLPEPCIARQAQILSCKPRLGIKAFDQR